MTLVDAISLVLYPNDDEKFNSLDKKVAIILDEAHRVIREHRHKLLEQLIKD